MALVLFIGQEYVPNSKYILVIQLAGSSTHPGHIYKLSRGEICVANFIPLCKRGESR